MRTNHLPQVEGRTFLTDGGLETTLMFHEGLELPGMAAFPLLEDARARSIMDRYFGTYTQLARRYGTGLVLESVTWRASPDWASKLGYDRRALRALNRESIRMLEPFRAECGSHGVPAVVSGCIGPRGDGYRPETRMSAEEAEQYHREQVETFASTSADMVCGITLNYAEEAIGILRAAERAEIPAAISFTVETDGRLPTCETLGSAIERIDRETSSYASYFMINCAHPVHFAPVLLVDEPWVGRVRGLRANASRKSHAELDEATELDSGNPAELGILYAALKRRLPHLTVLGGCCGTDHRHIEAIAKACEPLFRRDRAAA